MPAYLVYICQGVFDRAELETYWSKIGATLKDYSAQNLAAYTPFEMLEGEGHIDGVVLTEFESMEMARAWYNSPAYREIRHHRLDNTKYIGLLVDGGWRPPEQRMTHIK